MYVLSWYPDETTVCVDTWTDVVTFLSTLTLPSKTISLVTSKTKKNCEMGRERLLVVLNEAGVTINTLYVAYRPDVPKMPKDLTNLIL